MFTRYKGEILTLLGAIFFSFNGVIAKLVLTSGLSSMRLTQVRCGGAFIFLGIFMFIRYRDKLKAKKQELPWLFAYGIIGFLLVQTLYFVAIQRLNVSVALILEFTAPIWIVLWLRFVKHRVVPPLMWIAIFLAFGGLVLIAQVWKGQTLDPIGVSTALLCGIVLAGFFLLWSYPVDIFSKSMNLQGRFEAFDLPGWVLIAWVIIMGTIVPYMLILKGLKLLSASTSSVMGMAEPVLAGVFAWIWLSETWNFIQLVGGVTVIIGIILADKARSAAH
jgi:drug/metabolite transporter (DMT)-like permease